MPDPTSPAHRCGLSPETLARLGGVFARQPGVERVLIYGSRAKGTRRPGSDIDLALQGTGLGHADLPRIDRALDDLNLPYKIDLSLLHRIDNADLLDHIRRMGIVLYDKAPASSQRAA